MERLKWLDKLNIVSILPVIGSINLKIFVSIQG